MILLIFCIIKFISYGTCHPYNMRKLFLVNHTGTWNEFSTYCSPRYLNTTNMVRLFNPDPDTVSLLEYYVKTKDGWATEKDLWIGLYMSDIERQQFQFHGSCDILDGNEIGALLIDNFDHTDGNTLSWSTSTQCFYMAAMQPMKWRQESCDVNYKLGICEEILDMPCSYIPVECPSELALNKFYESFFVSQKENCTSFCEQISTCWLIIYKENANETSVCQLFTSTDPSQVFSDVCVTVEISKYFKRQCFEDPAIIDIQGRTVEISDAAPLVCIETTSQISVKSTTPSPKATVALPSSDTTSLQTTTTQRSTETRVSITQRSTSTRVTTTHPPTHTYTPPPVTPCYCLCNNTNDYSERKAWVANLDTTKEIKHLRQELLVIKTDLSSYKRKHNSAPDDRVVAQGIGLVLGAGVLCTVACLIGLPDLYTLIQYLATNRTSHGR